MSREQNCSSMAVSHRFSLVIADYIREVELVNNSLAEVREDRADLSKLVDEISGLNGATLHWPHR
jgi:hypothetical protein